MSHGLEKVVLRGQHLRPPRYQPGHDHQCPDKLGRAGVEYPATPPIGVAEQAIDPGRFDNVDGDEATGEAHEPPDHRVGDAGSWRPVRQRQVGSGRGSRRRVGGGSAARAVPPRTRRTPRSAPVRLAERTAAVHALPEVVVDLVQAQVAVAGLRSTQLADPAHPRRGVSRRRASASGRTAQGLADPGARARCAARPRWRQARRRRRQHRRVRMGPPWWRRDRAVPSGEPGSNRQARAA